MGRTTEPPISAELWERLRKFDATCSISFHRQRPQYDERWANLARLWCVTISPREGRGYDMVRAENPVLAEALSEAVQSAEAKRWAGPTPRSAG